jgi:hypothetical protein
LCFGIIAFVKLRNYMVIVIPEPDYRFGAVVFIGEYAQARGAQHKVTARTRVEAQPPGDQHAQKMAAGEEDHISSDGPDTFNNTVCALTDLRGRFAARAAVPEELPVRAVL